MDGMKKRTSDENDEFLSTIRDRFAAAESAESEIRLEAEKDLEFLAGDQWDAKIKKIRQDENRPALTFNHLPTYVSQVANEARQNKPQVRFGPVDSGADIDTADVLEGMARAIQRRSRADVAYETAFDYSASCSFGHYRMSTYYCDSESFDQHISFSPILDPFSVYGTLIPACLGQKPRWAIVLESMPREEFKAQYPESELVEMGWDAGAQRAQGWVTEEVRLAEYWRTESKRRVMRLALLPDGRRVKVYTNDLPKDSGISYELGSDGLPREREVLEEKIYSCLTNGVEVLPNTETEWAGRRIPIYTVLGRQLIVKGVPKLFSLVRFMRDPQQLLNAYKSGIAENIGLSNRVPYIGYKGQFKDPKWRNANVRNYPYLEVEDVQSRNGQGPLPIPQRQQFEAAIQALSVAAAQEIDDLKSIAGIFDASLGAQARETSGIAIQRRTAQSGLTNYHFIDNLKRTQTEAGEELGYLIPRVYDTEREVRIIGEDEEERIVKVNAPYIDPETGEQRNYMLDAGKYDVTVEIGPATSTKRQEAAEQTGQVISAAPELMGVIGDIFFRNSDHAGSSELADRMKKFIQVSKPGLIEEEKQAAEVPPQVQQQLQQSGQMIDQLTEKLNTLSEEIRTKRFELESRERIEQAKIELERERLNADILLKHEEMGSKEAIVQLQEQLAILREEINAARAAEQAEQQAEQQPQTEIA
jgi:hypothetical protein